MNSDKEMLEVVDENDVVTGIESRKTIHEKGLLHREIHIWFMTPNREIIFQHRAKDKDTWPDLLDATVGGHVEPGMSYEETAVKECLEETGLIMDPKDLREVKKMCITSFDKVTNTTNNTFRIQYVYLFKGDISDLKIEEGKSIGFEALKIDSLNNLSPEDMEKFIPIYISKEFLELFEEGQKLLGLK